MKKSILIFTLLFSTLIFAQKPRVDAVRYKELTTVQRDALVVPLGEHWKIYNITTGQFEYWTGLVWTSQFTSSNGITLSGLDFKLGGTLSADTNIYLGTNAFYLNDAESTNYFQWVGTGNGQWNVRNSGIGINVSDPTYNLNIGGAVSFSNAASVNINPTSLLIGGISVVDQVLTASGVNGETIWKTLPVTKSGTPAANQFARWLNSNTLLAIPEMTWDGSNFIMGDINGILTIRNLTGFSEIYASNRFDFETNSGVRINNIGKTSWVDIIPSGVASLTSPGTNGTIATEEFVTPTAQTGTVLDLSKNRVIPYNMAAASSSITYTTTGVSIGGAVKCLINAATEPTVTGATKISSPSFQANTDMFMVVYSDDGVNVEYYFLLK